MNAADLLTSEIAEASQALQRRDLSAVELVRACLDRIEEANPVLNAFITVDYDGALAAAKRADDEIAADQHRSALHGIPVAVKDNLPTAGLRTTYNSRAYASWTPARDVLAVSRLRDAGAIIVGKCNLNEFGWSIPDPSDLAPPPRNPWNSEHLAVGSSSGSAVAVASGMCMAALGTDGGGSTRLPASQMHLVGLKPTRGVVPGVEGPLDELSVVGVLARTGGDAAAVFAAVAQRRLPQLTSFKELRLGVPLRQINSLPVEPDVANAYQADLDALAAAGAQIIDVDLPHLEDARDANFVLLVALAHAAHSQDLRDRYNDIGVSARRYHLVGSVLSEEDCVNARRVAAVFESELTLALHNCDVLVTPVSTVATTAAARRPGEHNRGLNSTFTSPLNITGWPAISVPTAHRSQGIPIGLHAIGRPNEEDSLLRFAAWSRSTLVGDDKG